MHIQKQRSPKKDSIHIQKVPTSGINPMAFISSLKNNASWRRAPFMVPVISEWKTSIVGCTPSNIISSYTSLNKKNLNQKHIERHAILNNTNKKKNKSINQSNKEDLLWAVMEPITVLYSETLSA